MKVMNKLVKNNVSARRLNHEFLTMLNGIFNLTEREIELLGEFITLDINYVDEPKKHKNIANWANRRYIESKVNIAQDNLSRYIKSLIDKGMLVRGPASDELKVNKNVIPIMIGDRVQVTLILKLEQNDGDDAATGQHNNLEGV